MGEAVPKKNGVSKKSRNKKWDTKKLIESMKAYIESRKGMDIYHVIWRGGNRWGVLREGSKRMHKIYPDKQSAVTHAKELARKSPRWEVAIHKKNAGVEECLHS